jgi:hypothetical protein
MVSNPNYKQLRNVPLWVQLHPIEQANIEGSLRVHLLSKYTTSPVLHLLCLTEHYDNLGSGSKFSYLEILKVSKVCHSTSNALSSLSWQNFLVKLFRRHILYSCLLKWQGNTSSITFVSTDSFKKLRVSGDGIEHSELLGFWVLSIVRNAES